MQEKEFVTEEKEEKPVSEPKKEGLFKKLKRKLVRAKNVVWELIDERSKEVRHAKAKRVAVVAVVVFLAFAFVAFYFTLGKTIATFVKDPDGFKQWIDGFGNWSIVVFLVLRIIQTVTKLIPGEALEIAAGCVFGVWEGLLWCLLGSVIGSLIILWLGKSYGMRMIGLFVDPEKIHSISFLQNADRFNVTFFFLYLIPGTPKDVFTWLICVTDENPFKFLLLTTIARIPSVLVSTWCGYEFVTGDYLFSIVIFGSSLLLAVCGWLLYRHFNGKHKQKSAARAAEATSEGETANNTEA